MWICVCSIKSNWLKRHTYCNGLNSIIIIVRANKIWPFWKLGCLNLYYILYETVLHELSINIRLCCADSTHVSGLPGWYLMCCLILVCVTALLGWSLDVAGAGGVCDWEPGQSAARHRRIKLGQHFHFPGARANTRSVTAMLWFQREADANTAACTVLS